jgi:enoyl-CoA hydratase/carnithine racemase
MTRSPTEGAASGALELGRDGDVAIVRLNRPAKRNALDDPTVEALQAFFARPPDGVRAAVLCGAGEHFCAGLDLAELKARSAAEGLAHSRMWHRAFEEIQFGDVPVVAVVHGAVVGGGLELACAAHIRVAETTAFYALPEGSRGLFVGGGGSARIPHLIGIARMTDMMLTGRVYGAEEGQQIGLSTYLVAPGEGLAKGLELARKIAANAPLTNFAVMHALPRIAEAGQDHGLFTESLMAAVTQSEPEAKARLDAFLAGRAAKVDKEK